jgi:hypothetical protein
MLDTSAPGQIGTAPGQIGTRTLRHLCEKFRYQDKSATGQFDIPIRQIGTSKRQIGTCGFFKVVLAVASFWSLFNPNYLNLLSYKFFPADFRWSVIDGLKLFGSLITPIFVYSCEIWGFENIQGIEKMHLQYCKRILIK